MDKNAIKKYAVWARRELRERVTAKALQYGFSETEIVDINADSINGKVLTDAEKSQRKAFAEQIQNKGKSYEQVIEEVAYTWFNRFSALRFMEVNGYLPSHVRVFTNEENQFKPQILAEALHLELDGLDMEKVYDLKSEDKTDDLYRYLLITQCNALNKILPRMFQKIADYTELLFPDNLLREGSIIEQMVSMIPEEDWKDAVQIIGWLYQFYNIEPKADVFSKPKGTKITKKEIPAATQLFTPDWIVRYMVENSLGRIWVEGHPDDELKAKWKYYLDEAEQESDVQEQLEEMYKEYANLKPEDIRCIDPCMGSGHILCYMFDVLVQIYEGYGYTVREAVTSIVENNIYGLDIDKRATQLAYFAVMMKARQYDRRYFSRKDEEGNLAIPQPNVYVILESNHLNTSEMEYFVNGDDNLQNIMDILCDELHNATEYGSILDITEVDFSSLCERFEEIEKENTTIGGNILENIKPFVKVAQIMAQKYEIVVTNPPYMPVSNAGKNLNDYVKREYPDSKMDLFAVFIEKCNKLTKPKGYQAMITMHSWMFLSSYEKLRKKILLDNIVNMAHLGTRAFEEIGGEVVQTTSFIIQKSQIDNYVACYCRLVDFASQSSKQKNFLLGTSKFFATQKYFEIIPGNPFAYWVSEDFLSAYKNKKIEEYAKVTNGLFTCDNKRFLRMWYETNSERINFSCCSREECISSNKEWYPYNKGGEYRRWYGNHEYIVKFGMFGSEISAYRVESGQSASFPGQDYYFQDSVSWSLVSSSKFGVRYYPKGFVFDIAGSSVFPNRKEDIFYILGFLASEVAIAYLRVTNPTINYQAGDVKKLPFRIGENKEKVNEIVLNNIKLSKQDWDSFETSWDFLRHPLLCYAPNNSIPEVPMNYTIASAFDSWSKECEERFYNLKANEEELNRIFIDIYGLQDELTPEVEEKDVTVRKADLQRDIKSFISYAVGCMFGRYSLDSEGLAYAGGEWDDTKYSTYEADRDNIIPICDDEYFEDDIVGKFCEFVATVYGEDSLDENLRFIADALGGKGTPKEVIRSYFNNEFYKDHCKIYQKRPIYWLFDSGKKSGFKCLIYMHRYQPDTIARIRTDYLHQQQARYRTTIEDLEQRVEQNSGSERVRLTKELKKRKEQEQETREYEEKIHHLADQMISIDLDDGVKKNYELFKDVLAKIK